MVAPGWEAISTSIRGRVCRLVKSLYGHLGNGLPNCQVPCSILASLNLRLIIPCVTKHDGATFTTILIYVDDMIITRNSLPVVTIVKHYLHAEFYM